ncbi:hypothetical protein METBIDRAFT_77451 [Metschnikowia bicuspidata var. bicuspidata NRRL YB-4993]|uniref:CinA C-terminal domain-containing protein n=1 Tax=Metschnikowia bicuspidata var. bicuspidata NRRL YB-4993 TaxID=869754 RepID=A0A1A0HD62_9ASCO|nr:hypothetical protein METBIDRAFT_77451 [Metschnikowia bicuspidata var. bicuspidata NRRL YB-4993]OBA21910.1 hypothetical protein METBIDRAFT_77451 [Metschnikowia bicuspidata var. bicuspidata NRRL YB-4993]
MSAFPPASIKLLVEEIATILRDRGQTLAVSEAACGGLLLAYIVSVNGASNFYIGGKLVYLVKQRLKLSGWTDDEIHSYVGPLEQVALKLARTTKYELGSTYVLSETGYAGPTTDLHLAGHGDHGQVGTVFLGLSGPCGDISIRHETGLGDRSANMELFARLGLEFLLDQLKSLAQ